MRRAQRLRMFRSLGQYTEAMKVVAHGKVVAAAFVAARASGDLNAAKVIDKQALRRNPTIVVRFLSSQQLFQSFPQRLIGGLIVDERELLADFIVGGRFGERFETAVDLLK